MNIYLCESKVNYIVHFEHSPELGVFSVSCELTSVFFWQMRRYDEVIKLCEKTLGSAEKNSPLVDTAVSSDGSELSKYLYFRLWRCRLIFKSYFHLGKLEEGLSSLEKQEEKVFNTYR